MDAESLHVRFGGSEGFQEVGVRVPSQFCIYGQVREDVDRGPDLMKDGGLPVHTVNCTAGDVYLQRKVEVITQGLRKPHPRNVARQ